MTEEKLKEAENAVKNESSDVVDEIPHATDDTAVQSDQKTDELSNFSEQKKEKETEKKESLSEQKADQNEDEIVHAEKVVEQTNKSDESSGDFKGIYECALTTADNPFDPLQNFDEWFQFDEQKGFHTCAYLGRIAQISDEMSDEEVLIEIERAIDEIIALDFMNIYRKVKRPAENL